MQRENNIKFYRTNSGLGYNKYAILLGTPQGYLVIDTIGVCNDSYRIGEFIMNDDCDWKILEEYNYDIKQSPLYDEYLFQFFIKTLNKLKKDINAR